MTPWIPFQMGHTVTARAPQIWADLTSFTGIRSRTNNQTPFVNVCKALVPSSLWSMLNGVYAVWNITWTLFRLSFVSAYANHLQVKSFILLNPVSVKYPMFYLMFHRFSKSTISEMSPLWQTEICLVLQFINRLLHSKIIS